MKSDFRSVDLHSLCFVNGLAKDASNRHDYTMAHCQGTTLVCTASRISAPHFSN